MLELMKRFNLISKIRGEERTLILFTFFSTLVKYLLSAKMITNDKMRIKYCIIEKKLNSECYLVIQISSG